MPHTIPQQRLSNLQIPASDTNNPDIKGQSITPILLQSIINLFLTMKGLGLTLLATALCTSSAFVTPSTREPVSFTILKASTDGISDKKANSGLRKVAEAFLATSLCFGVLTPINAVHAASDIDYRLPPIDRSDPDRCTLKSSSIGQSNAQRDKLFDLRECKLEGANAQGYDLSGVIM
jgi:hypothetical protein